MSHVLPVYRRSVHVMVRGAGVYLYGPDDQKYLDFAAGIAVNALGHCHPHVTAALKAQADTLWHCANMYTLPGQEKLAERLANASGMDAVFFCSTGAEAVEAAVKMARRYHHMRGRPHRNRIITMNNGFHGRTLVGISAGGNAAAREGYAPLAQAFDAVTFNDIHAVQAAISDETAAVLLEPVQGEGGIIPATAEFLRAVRALCDAHGLLLILDEVQCGMGRTGHLFAHQAVGVTPDIMAVAKGIGNGFPLAACLSKNHVAQHMTPGSHGSTYGGNPLAMAVGNAVLDVMLADGFMPHVRAMGALLHSELQKLAMEFPHVIADVRGVGLMIGMQLQPDISHQDFAEMLRVAGLLTAPCYHNTIRLTPPLIIDETHIGEAMEILRRACSDLPRG